MFLFRLKRTVKLGIKSLWMHKLRSMLTMLGIIFGVSSVIAMLAIGEGASRQTQEKIARLGSRNIIIKTIDPQEEQSAAQQQMLKEYGLTYADSERLRKSIPNVQVLVPNRLISEQAQYRTSRISIEVVGTVPWFPDISPIETKYGRFIHERDMDYKQGVCVVDEKVVRDLFGIDSPLGQTIKIATDYYTVIGIASEQEFDEEESSAFGSSASQSDSKKAGANLGRIYIPLTTARTRFGEMSLSIGSSGGSSIEKVELQEIIVQCQNEKAVMDVRKSVETILSRFHKKNDYEIIVPIELMKRAEEIQQIFTIVLGSIAAISLIVGGIGIMNIMLATVSERTREIGIRRALGARKKDIVLQFLSETLLLTFLGGIMGLFIGFLIPFLVAQFTDTPTAITAQSMILAFGISAVVGVTFGLYPAYRAANMDPIESLRHE